MLLLSGAAVLNTACDKRSIFSVTPIYFFTSLYSILISKEPSLKVKIQTCQYVGWLIFMYKVKLKSRFDVLFAGVGGFMKNVEVSFPFKNWLMSDPLPNVKISAMCSKFNSSQSKTYFSQFFDKLSNWGNGISNSLCEVWNVNSLILSKLHILFSTVTLKLGHKCSQFIHIFKIQIFWVLALGCTYKLFPIYNEILGFLNVALEIYKI